jgi:ElaB/YqjD/DUF883 family membrane-anchored ribosome-binding protein
MVDPRNEELLRDLDRLVEEVDRMKDEGLEAHPNLAKLKAEIEARLEKVKARLGTAAQDARAGIERGARVTDEYVHSHPWESAAVSAAIGAGLGFLLGMLVSRR